MVLEGPYETLLRDDRVRRSYLGLTLKRRSTKEPETRHDAREHDQSHGADRPSKRPWHARMPRRQAWASAGAAAALASRARPGADAAGSENRHAGAAVRPLGAPGHPGADGRRAGDRRRQQCRRHQVYGRRQAEAGRVRHRGQRGEGQGRRAAHGGAGARPGRRLRLLAVQLHPRRDRGDRARRAAVAHAVLFRPDHRARLQIRLPVVARPPTAGRRRCCR